MASLFEYFDNAWEMTVLPHPNAPGMAHVPPSTLGNMTSKTLCPVNRGWFAMSFSATGRGVRTDHFCSIV
jgi:hypothetical protein